jgi:Skp family chaperone for outer membrane proteins
VLNVTKPTLVAAVGGILLVLGLAALTAEAQRPAAQGVQPQGGVALLDVSRVFKNHDRFQQMMAQMKTDVQAEEEAVKKEKETIGGLVEQLKGLKAGSPDYKQLEQHIATRQADLNVNLSLRRKEFLLREAKIYHGVYQELQQEVQSYAARAGIAIVLRYNGDPVDAENPEDVLRDINKPVVSFAPGVDITDAIVQQIRYRNGGNVPAAERSTQRPGVPYPPRR